MMRIINEAAEAALNTPDGKLALFVSFELKKPLQTDGLAYLIHSKWLELCLESLRAEEGSALKVNIPPISNDLLFAGGELRSDLYEHQDYRILTLDAWKVLVERFGGGPAIPRKVFVRGLSTEKLVEVYPLKLTVEEHIIGKTKSVTISTTAKLQSLCDQLSNLLGLPSLKGRQLFVSDGGDEWHSILLSGENLTKKLSDLKFGHTTKLSIAWNGSFNSAASHEYFTRFAEKHFSSKVADLTEDDLYSNDEETTDDKDIGFNYKTNYSPNWNSTSSVSQRTSSSSVRTSSPSSYSSLYSLRSAETYDHGRAYGAVGLGNLGNTCFMNSALQCLSHTAPLTKYFLAGHHINDLNRTNPLGSKGALAEAYVSLLHSMWDNKGNSSIRPTRFHGTICDFAPQFSGFRQQDSQELLAFLLDGLHEDLNKIISKPYIESVEGDGRPDVEVANEAWRRHLSRNTSVIVDTFQVTFDPFMYLSLPISSPFLEVDVIYVPYGDDPTRVAKYRFRMQKRASMRNLRKDIADKFELNSYEIALAVVRKNSIETIVLTDSVLKYTSSCLYAYQLRFGPEIQEQYYELAFNHCYSNQNRGGELTLVGEPFVVVAPDPCRARNIQVAVTRLLHNSDLGESARDKFEIYRKGNMSRNLMDERYANEIETHMNDTFLVKWKSKQIFDEFCSREYAVDDTTKGIPRMAVGDSSSLLDCLRSFVTPEKLGKDNAWFCPKCKAFQQATKKFDIWKMPQILIVHLKRFQYEGSSRDKITTEIRFPIEGLDLTNFVLSEEDKRLAAPVYNLFAVSEHSGGLNGGHYTAYAKNHLENIWYYFNDSSVSTAQPSESQSSGAYLLFYERVGGKTPSKVKDSPSNFDEKGEKGQ